MKYWRYDARVTSKFDGEGRASGSRASRLVRIHISQDEWRDIHRWMYLSLGETEKSPMGHFLLQIKGRRRRWVCTDDAQLATIEVDGPVPEGDYNRSEPLTLLVNSRLFRSCDATDATLEIAQEGGRFVQSLCHDGLRIKMPQPHGKYPNWEGLLAKVVGQRIGVEGKVLIEACHTAGLSPTGHDWEESVTTWLCVRNNTLIMETPWTGFPPTRVEITLDRHTPDTKAIPVDIMRLAMLVHPVQEGAVDLIIPDIEPARVGVSSGNYQGVLMSLDRIKPVRERLEALLKEILLKTEMEADEDGDYSVISPHGHQLWVRMHVNAEPVNVQVFSVLATDVEPTAGLMEELNSINASAAYVKVLWIDGAVIAETDLAADLLSRGELENALTTVWDTVDRYRSILGAWFGSALADEEADE